METIGVIFRLVVRAALIVVGLSLIAPGGYCVFMTLGAIVSGPGAREMLVFGAIGLAAVIAGLVVLVLALKRNPLG